MQKNFRFALSPMRIRAFYSPVTFLRMKPQRCASRRENQAAGRASRVRHTFPGRKVCKRTFGFALSKASQLLVPSESRRGPKGGTGSPRLLFKTEAQRQRVRFWKEIPGKSLTIGACADRRHFLANRRRVGVSRFPDLRRGLRDLGEAGGVSRLKGAKLRTLSEPRAPFVTACAVPLSPKGDSFRFRLSAADRSL